MDFVIQSSTHINGTLVSKFHLKKAVVDSNAKFVYLNGQPYTRESTLSRDSTQQSTKASKITTGEVAIATRKIVIKKSLKDHTVTKLINLNGISATCPMLNLKRNDQNLIYLKANELSLKALHNRERIRRYLRDNHIQLQILENL